MAGTCEWIIHNASYRAWLYDDDNDDSNNDDNTRLLWISGGPGKGTYGWSGAAGTIAFVEPRALESAYADFFAILKGKAHLVIAIGCTGGRHRSVAIAEHLAAAFRDREQYFVEVQHRDVDRIARSA